MAFDSSGGVRPSSVHATSVHLTEVHLPALDATSNSGTMQLTLVMAPQRTEPLAAGTQVTDSIEMTGSRPSNFRLALSGAAQQRTIHVEPIVITRSGSGALDISNIVEDVPFVDAHDTLAWRDDYVVQGHTSNQRSVVLDLLSSAGTSVFALQFSQVGIVSAALNPQIAADDTLARVRVELFANRVSVLAPGTTTSSTGTSTSTTTPLDPEPRLQCRASRRPSPRHHRRQRLQSRQQRSAHHPRQERQRPQRRQAIRARAIQPISRASPA
jgi:hypothetical protein